MPVKYSLAQAVRLAIGGNAVFVLAGIVAANAPTASALANVIVQNCNDSGSGSLREAYENFAGGSDQSIDLTNLACSKITLSSGALIDNRQPQAVHILGGGVTIDGQNLDRVFVHGGTGTLEIDDMIVQNGSYNGPFGGGCIYSSGSVTLGGTIVTGCSLNVAGDVAATGGAIFAVDEVFLIGGKVTNSEASSGMGNARGGGIYARRVISASAEGLNNGSLISGNKAQSGNLSLNNPSGGGFYASAYASILCTELSRNEAGIGAGGSALQSYFSNTTVSSNMGGAAIYSSGSARIYSSTIANNHGTATTNVISGLIASSGKIVSTIIANNANFDGSKAIDLKSSSADGKGFVFEKDIITSANFTLPSNVLQSDPKLGPLQRNGGNTMTHALLAGSPAINRGSNPSFFKFDQRGAPYSREDGASADIGAFETSDRIFSDGVDRF